VLEVGVDAGPLQLVLLLPLAHRGLDGAPLLDRLLARVQKAALVRKARVGRLVARRRVGAGLERGLALLFETSLLSADLGDARRPFIALPDAPRDRRGQFADRLVQSLLLARQGEPALVGGRQRRARLRGITARPLQFAAQQRQLRAPRLDRLKSLSCRLSGHRAFL